MCWGDDLREEEEDDEDELTAAGSESSGISPDKRVRQK